MIESSIHSIEVKEAIEIMTLRWQQALALVVENDAIRLSGPVLEWFD